MSYSFRSASSLSVTSGRATPVTTSRSAYSVSVTSGWATPVITSRSASSVLVISGQATPVPTIDLTTTRENENHLDRYAFTLI